MKQATIRKFSSINSPPLPPPKQGEAKKSVPGPTSPLHVFSLLLFSTFRRPMFIEPMTKAAIYLCAAAAGSLLFDFVHLPPSYFSNKYNIINIFFVKWGWGWTCISLASFVIFSSFVYTGGKVGLMRSHILRIVTGTGFWYCGTGLINFVHDMTGRCHPSDLFMASGERPFRRVSCHRLGGVWFGFDISGHCFLLVLANLWIMEELRCLKYWPKLAEILKPFDTSTPNDGVDNVLLRGLSVNESIQIRSSFRRLTGPIRVLFCAAACLSMLWDFMLLVTIVYFHTMPTKLLGTLMAVVCWFISYRVVFPKLKTGDWYGLAPGMPGDSMFDFMPKR